MSVFPPRAKIVCTLGPSSNSLETIERLVTAGMSVARLNFSHGSHADHLQVMKYVREIEEKLGKPLAILADLQGPKIRIGHFAKGKITLKEGARFTITTREMVGDETCVSTSYRGLSGDVGAGDILLLDDGMLALKVTQVQKGDVVCKVITGGELKDHKGINVPNAALSVSAITEKDRADAHFAIDQGVDYLAMSFVRQPEDVLSMRKMLWQRGDKTPIIAKIEKPQALDCIDDIIAAADGIMVARGDLGVEMPPENVPATQKSIIHKCKQAGKPVITATQMLESMVRNPRPTRAEASDVANAVLDGSDSVMLSAESASGRYPIEAVSVMRRIIQAIEQTKSPTYDRSQMLKHWTPSHPNEGVALAACTLSETMNSIITTITLTGSMATLISRHRPNQPIIALSHSIEALRKLSLYWGVESMLIPNLTSNLENALFSIETHLMKNHWVKNGDFVVVTIGLPFASRQATNTLRITRVHV